MVLKSNDGLPLRAKVFIYGIQLMTGDLYEEILVFRYFERTSFYKVPSVLKEEVDVTSNFMSSMCNHTYSSKSILKLNSTYHRQKRRWGYGIAVCRSDNQNLEGYKIFSRRVNYSGNAICHQRHSPLLVLERSVWESKEHCIQEED